MQVEQGNADVQQASRAFKLAVLKEAEVVVSTLGAAGGDLLALSAGQLGFDAVIIDEVLPFCIVTILAHLSSATVTLVLHASEMCCEA